MKTVKYSEYLPNPKELGLDVLCIADKKLLDKNPIVKKWVKNCTFLYVVESGEKLKDFNKLHIHINKIIKLTSSSSKRRLTIVALGGGTVGDFTGFIASVFKRGVDFIQIPSTWLAAIDSSHGGKNGFNVGPYKNQIGTVYLPKKIFIVKEVLKSQPDVQIQDAMGELLKTALLDGSLRAKKSLQISLFDFDFMWNSLKWAVPAKYKVVNQDLYETKGIRYVLNLGHTMGHVVELNQKLSHGQSVFWGLEFAIHLSLKRGLIKSKDAEMLLQSPAFRDLKSKITPLKRMSKRNLIDTLGHDKKRESKELINYVLVKKIGRVCVEKVSIKEILETAMELGWVSK